MRADVPAPEQVNNQIGNQPGSQQVLINGLRQRDVFRAVGAVPVVVFNQKTVKVLLAASGNVGNELLRRFTGFFGGNHDGSAVGVVSANKIDRVALHSLKAHPNVGLDIFHNMPDVECAIGIWQGSGHENLAWCTAHSKGVDAEGKKRAILFQHARGALWLDFAPFPGHERQA